MTKIKICGLTRQQDAELALEFGADLLGFIFEPQSKRFVGERWAPDWLATLAAPKVAVFKTMREPASDLFDFHQAHEFLVQPSEEARRVHTIRLDDDVDVAMQLRAGDALLIDALDAKGLGGTGQTVDWNRAADFVARLPGVRVFLAGGLTPENVGKAIAAVRPWGVDVCSGTEANPGIKDPAKLRGFIEAVRAASESI